MDPDSDQLALSEANRSGSKLFFIRRMLNRYVYSALSLTHVQPVKHLSYFMSQKGTCCVTMFFIFFCSRRLALEK